MQQDHSTKSNVMLLNEEKQVINEQENEVGVSNAMIAFNERFQTFFGV